MRAASSRISASVGDSEMITVSTKARMQLVTSPESELGHTLSYYET